jgi:hypothetical protein
MRGDQGQGGAGRGRGEGQDEVGGLVSKPCSTKRGYCYRRIAGRLGRLVVAGWRCACACPLIMSYVLKLAAEHSLSTEN